MELLFFEGRGRLGAKRTHSGSYWHTPSLTGERSVGFHVDTSRAVAAGSKEERNRLRCSRATCPVARP